MSAPADDVSTPIPRDDEGRPIGNPSASEPTGPSDDEREVTGEPVETDAGWVTPRQQNVGRTRIATTANPAPKSAPS
jgi:hypothetical protein